MFLGFERGFGRVIRINFLGIGRVMEILVSFGRI